MKEITLSYNPHHYKCSYDSVYLVHRFITKNGGLLRIREFGDYLDPNSLPSKQS